MRLTPDLSFDKRPEPGHPRAGEGGEGDEAAAAAEEAAEEEEEDEDVEEEEAVADDLLAAAGARFMNDEALVEPLTLEGAGAVVKGVVDCGCLFAGGEADISPEFCGNVFGLPAAFPAAWMAR